MGLEISNAKLSMSSDGLSTPKKTKKTTPSIAEQAIFIPKPKKRVDFKLNKEIIALEPSQQNGSKIKPDLAPKTSKIVKPHEKLGKHGISANVKKKEYKPKPVQDYVTVEQITPEKDFSFAPAQEEGRQINNKQLHFTQQYDSHGRPRMGFSREPYDFAATKYIQATSDLKFQENIDETNKQSRDLQDKVKDNVPEPEKKPLPESDDGTFYVKG